MAGSLGELLVSIGIDPSGLSSGAGQVESSLESLGTRLFFLGSRIGAAFSVPLAGAIGAIEHYGAAFDQAMTESLAIMDHVTPEMRTRMEEQARVISETTKFSSTEAAKAYYDLASAGLNAAEAVNALPVVARFAQAGMMDLAKAGEWLTGSQAALGLKTDDASQNLMQMARISDVLTTVNNKSIGTLKDYAIALTNQGAVAMRTYGVSLEEGVAILGVFGQQHILGARAGTLLNATLRDLTRSAVTHKDAFDKARISVFDANRNMRNMADIADDLTRKFGPMNTEARRTELNILGLRDRSLQGILALIGMGDQLRSLQTDLLNAGGATEVVAQKQLQSFNTQMAMLGHQFENVAIRIFASFVPAFNDYVVPLIQKAVGYAKDLADYFDSLSESTKGLALAAAGFTVALGPILIALGGIVLVVRVLVGAYDTLVTAWGLLSLVAESVAGVALGTVGIWVGVAVAVGGVIYAVKEMAGGWSGLADIINGFTGGALYAIVNGFKWLTGVIIDHKQVFLDLASVVEAFVIVAFKAMGDQVRDLVAWGHSVTVGWGEWKALLKPLALAWDVLGTSISTVNNFLRDHVGWIASTEDWISKKWSGALDTIIQKYKDVVKWAKEVNQSANAHDIELPSQKPYEWTGPLNPNKRGGPGDPSDPASPKKRIQSIFDEISGKKALEDAATWMAGIERLGGASQVAESDINRALKVFDSAIDRMEKMGKGGSAAAEAMYDMRDSLFWASEAGWKLVAAIDKIELKGKPVGQMTATNMGLGFTTPNTMGLTEYLKVRKELLKVETSGSMVDLKASDKIPGFISAQTIRDSLKMASILPGLAKGFLDLGRSIHGAAGTTITELGRSFSVMNDAQKATEQLGLNQQKLGGSYGYLSVMTNDQATRAEKTQATMMALTAVIGGAKAVWDATSQSASALGNAIGGMMKGAEAGAAFGPLGMAIGAAAGFMVGIIRGKPEWAKAAEQIANDFGVQISDKLAKAIEEGASKFGNSTQASAVAHLSDIIKEAGGLDASNLSTMTDRLHDVFSMIETHHMTITQGTKVLEQNWGSFVKAGTDAYGFLDQKLVDLIKLNKTFGTDAKAITDYLKAQTSEVAAGFNLIAMGGMKPLNDSFAELQKAGQSLVGGSSSGKTDQDQGKIAVGLLQQIEDAHARIQTIKDKGAKATASDLQTMKDLQAKLPLLQADYERLSDAQKAAASDLAKGLKGGQDEFDRLGRLAQLAFGAALASGKTFLEAIEGIGPGLDQLSLAAKNFGFTQSDAFGQLIGIRNFTQANKELVGELDGVNKMIVGLANSGMLTQSSFTDLGAEAQSVFDRMKRQGLDGNTALLMMKPTLQTLWEAQQRFGFKVDDATQALLDQATQSGIVGEASKSDSAKMVAGIDTLNKTLKDLVSALTGGVGGAFDALAVKARTVTSDIGGYVRGIPTRVDFDVNTRYHASGDRDDTPHMASGGILTGPRRVLAGEAGPEAIIPLSKLKEYLQPQNASASGSGQMPDMVVQIDGREIARATLSYMPEELRRNGIF